MSYQHSGSLLLTKWSARPDWDDFVQTIEFIGNGTGRIVSGGGQVISLVADFTFTVSANQLTIRFRNTDESASQFVVTPASAILELDFKIVTGAYELFAPAAGHKATFTKKLQLSGSPLPANAAEYHRGNIFFSGINSIDPRSFSEFLA